MMHKAVNADNAVRPDKSPALHWAQSRLPSIAKDF